MLTAEKEPGRALRMWLHHRLPAVAPGVAPVLRDRAVLAGHAQTPQRLRTRLRLSGVPRSAITTKAYWATGRSGLRRAHPVSAGWVRPGVRDAA